MPARTAATRRRACGVTSLTTGRAVPSLQYAPRPLRVATVPTAAAADSPAQPSPPQPQPHWQQKKKVAPEIQARYILDLVEKIRATHVAYCSHDNRHALEGI